MSATVTPTLLRKMKREGMPIVALTAYDCGGANIVDRAGVDVILVGDSLGMVVMGLEDTIGVTMDTMVYHTSMVARGVDRAMVVSDLPFLSYHLSIPQALENAGSLLQESGCQAVKLEGYRPETVSALVDAGIPVMGHLGLTPQSMRLSGLYRVAGRRKDEQIDLLKHAQDLQDAGCFAIVLEAVMPEPARQITESLTIPTIGIGSGSSCDGQILVFHDLLGLTPDPPPRFVRRYESLADKIHEAVKAYADDVREHRFPTAKESYAKE